MCCKLQEEMAKAAKKAEDKLRKEQEKEEKQMRKDKRAAANKQDVAEKPKRVTKKKETDAGPTGSSGSNKRKAKHMEPTVNPDAADVETPAAAERPSHDGVADPAADDGVAASFQRLQAVDIDHFKVDLKGHKSFTVKPPSGSGASSIGCILSGSGSFYVYKTVGPQELQKLPVECQVKAGSPHCDVVRVRATVTIANWIGLIYKAQEFFSTTQCDGPCVMI
eukprot:s3370_g3.t1